MILIQNAKINGSDKKQDILIKDGTIDKIGVSLESHGCKEVIDADGFIAFASIVDLNVRLKDDLLTISKLQKLYESLSNAGIGTFVLSPRFEPLVDNETFKALLSEELEKKFPNLKLSIKALKDKENKKLNNISRLLQNDIKIVQERSDIDGNLLRRIYEYSKMHRNFFFVFCENKILNDSGVMNEGEVSFALGLPGISKIGEISEVARVVQFSKHYDVPTLFQSLSTTRAVDIVYKNKKEFPDLYSEVSIHHLCLDENSCSGFNTYAKLNPPLRTEADKEGLKQRLKEGKIDILTSLYSPKSIVHKDVAFFEAKYGIDSIDDYLSICYTYLVKSGLISWNDLAQLVCVKPAQILGESDIGKIEEGYKANIILFDPNSSYEVSDTTSPYLGKTLYGKIKRVIS